MCRLQSMVCIFAVMPVVMSFLGTSLAVMCSRWSVLDNAISDLGHPRLGVAAIILNICLALSAYFLSLYSVLYLLRVDRANSILLLLASLLLLLVAVLNISFGLAHFVVSICFFLSLMIFVMYNIIKHRSSLLALGLVLAIVLWITHFTWYVPRGAAVSELISLVVAIACYLRYCIPRT